MTGVTYPAGSANAGNGTSGAFTFDDHGRPAGVVWTDPASGLVTSDAVTSRDQLGRVVNRSTDGHDPNGSTANYGYSASGELTSAVGFAAAPGPAAATGSFVYDYAATGGCGVAATAGANVNRISKTIDAGTPVTYCYDHADRLTATSEPAETVSIAAGTLAYDAHGNTSRLGDEVYSYDIADRHSATSAAPGASGVPTVEYVRDATDGIVQRSLNGTVTGRYAATAAGAPSAVLNSSNIAVSATVGLPGGTSYSFDPQVHTLNGTWHHPNLTGHRVATTNTTGTKTGTTTVYDPDGNLQAGTLPDDKPGNFDAAWHGGGGVNLEHETGLHPMIQMGARQYSPILARFLEIDPIEGGCSNDYTYVGDPINNSDLTGLYAFECHYGKLFRVDRIHRSQWRVRSEGRIFNTGLTWQVTSRDVRISVRPAASYGTVFFNANGGMDPGRQRGVTRWLGGLGLLKLSCTGEACPPSRSSTT